MYRYRVRYYRTNVHSRVIRVTVTAATADEARAMARIRDPQFSHTVETPRRIGLVVEEPDECSHETVRDQERVDGIYFGVCVDCHENVCATGPEDDRGEPGWELASREFTGFRGTSVEVV